MTQINALTEVASQTQKTNLWVPKGKGGEGGRGQELGIRRNRLLFTKQISDKNLH